mgnify:CR=1 FL=1
MINLINKLNRNCNNYFDNSPFIQYEEVKNDYEFGLSVYCSSKIKLQKYKIYK